jgi:hypothetical protein
MESLLEPMIGVKDEQLPMEFRFFNFPFDELRRPLPRSQTGTADNQIPFKFPYIN